MAFDNDENLMSEINVTPLVDVMLVLLIIFMITAPMLTYGVKVNLPTTTSKPIPTKQEPLLITLDQNKNVFIDRYKIPLKKLDEKLKPIIKANPKRNVLLQADQRVSYGYVMQVMAKIKLAGIEQLGLVTKPLKKR
ncbi:MAG: protein TolR [Thermodesulfobacteriota bacterium]|nr:protein TolR [Candidatus Desulfofervidus sp.]RKX62804.1 MAG: protein TolR [Thermodesulfobacteriota bacterium]